MKVAVLGKPYFPGSCRPFYLNVVIRWSGVIASVQLNQLGPISRMNPSSYYCKTGKVWLFKLLRFSASGF